MPSLQGHLGLLCAIAHTMGANPQTTRNAPTSSPATCATLEALQYTYGAAPRIWAERRAERGQVLGTTATRKVIHLCLKCGLPATTRKLCGKNRGTYQRSSVDVSRETGWCCWSCPGVRTEHALSARSAAFVPAHVSSLGDDMFLKSFLQLRPTFTLRQAERRSVERE